MPASLARWPSESESGATHWFEAYLVVERLVVSGGRKRRGRPPKWMAAAKSQNVPETKGKSRQFNAATRRRMAAAQKKSWAARNAQLAA